MCTNQDDSRKGRSFHCNCHLVALSDLTIARLNLYRFEVTLVPLGELGEVEELSASI